MEPVPMMLTRGRERGWDEHMSKRVILLCALPVSAV